MPDMRFAPPKQLRIADRTDGLNPERTRSYNERVVLSLLVQNPGISRLEIGERTKLSQQTVSVIVRSLEHEGLVSRGEAMRGRVGPPTIPVLLNPNGAFAVGVDFGDANTEVVLIDFSGRIRYQKSVVAHGTAEKDQFSGTILLVEEAIRFLPQDQQSRIAGIGIAISNENRIKPVLEAATVAENSLRVELENKFQTPVFIQNDITAAVCAEMMFGSTINTSDYLFAFIGGLTHTRLVLANHIYTGNFKIGTSSFDTGLIALDRIIQKERPELKQAYLTRKELDPRDKIVSDWREKCVESLAFSMKSLSQFVDVNTVIISSSLPSRFQDLICLDLQNGLSSIKVVKGQVTLFPKAVGAGSLPFIARFTSQG